MRKICSKVVGVKKDGPEKNWVKKINLKTVGAMAGMAVAVAVAASLPAGKVFATTPPVYVSNKLEELMITRMIPSRSYVEFTYRKLGMREAADSVRYINFQYGGLSDYELHNLHTETIDGHKYVGQVETNWMRNNEMRTFTAAMMADRGVSLRDLVDTVGAHIDIAVEYQSDTQRSRVDFSRCVNSSVFFWDEDMECRMEYIGGGMVQYHPYNAEGMRMEIPIEEDIALSEATVTWRAESGEWGPEWYGEGDEPGDGQGDEQGDGQGSGHGDGEIETGGEGENEGDDREKDNTKQEEGGASGGEDNAERKEEDVSSGEDNAERKEEDVSSREDNAGRKEEDVSSREDNAGRREEDAGTNAKQGEGDVRIERNNDQGSSSEIRNNGKVVVNNDDVSDAGAGGGIDVDAYDSDVNSDDGIVGSDESTDNEVVSGIVGDDEAEVEVPNLGKEQSSQPNWLVATIIALASLLGVVGWWILFFGKKNLRRKEGKE